MFLPASGGSLDYAQIVAFGLAALGSLSLSMTNNLSVSMTLRLRSNANANACSRSAERNRRAVAQSRLNNQPTGMPRSEPDDDAIAAAVIASMAAHRQRADESQATVHQRPRTSESQTAAPAAHLADQRRTARWAEAATRVAAEHTAALSNLPPAERQAASTRAAMLSSCAQDLLAVRKIRPHDPAAYPPSGTG